MPTRVRPILLLLALSLPLGPPAVMAEEGSDTAAVLAEAPDSLVAAIDSTAVEEVHPQDSPANRGFLVITADGKSSLRLRGSIRLAGGFDFNGLLGKTAFSTVEIPVDSPEGDDTAFFMAANQSRVGLEVTQDSRYGDAFMRVEMDFLGDGNRARLRHAYGRLGPLLAGQTWSTFSDVNSLPLTVDLDGPNSSVAERKALVRLTLREGDDTRLAVGIEAPAVEFDEPDTLTLRPSFQTFPDVAAWTRHTEAWGHVQVSGVVRSITVANRNGELDQLVGLGGLFSGVVEISPSHRLLWQGVAGSGIAKFVTGFAGRNFDVVYNPGTGSFETLGLVGGYLSYAHRWAEDLESYFTAGSLVLLDKDYQPDDDYHDSQYVSGNLFMNVGEGSRMGVEYTWGRRENKGGASGTANRAAFIVYYDF